MNKIEFDENEVGRLNALKLYDILDTLPEQEFDDLARLASEICQTPIALISLIDEERQWFKSHIGLDINETSREFAFCTHAIESDLIFEVPNPLEDVRFANNPLVVGYPNIRFYAGAPLINKDGFRFGTLCVIHSRPHAITDNQKNSLKILARSVISLFELRKEKKEAEFYKKALDEVSIFAVLDGNLKYEYVNEKFCALAEMRQNEIIGKSRGEVALADETRDQEEKIAEDINNKRTYKGKIKNQSKNGTITWSNIALIPLTNKDNTVVKILSVRNDITIQELMAERMQEAERLSKIGNWELNLINGTSTWSDGMFEMLDFNADQRIGRPTLLDLVSAEDRDRINDEYKKIIEDGAISSALEFKVKTRKDKEKYIYAVIRKRINSKGQLVSVYGTMQDITERKTNENALAESLRKVRDLYNNAPCGYHSVDAKGCFIDINNTELRWLGYTRDEVMGKLTLEDIFEGHDVISFEDFKKSGYLKDLPRVLKCKDGRTIHCLASATAIYDANGNFLNSRTTLYDITELKKIQDRLEESENKYRALVEESAQMSFTTDVEGRFTYASTRLKKIIGYEDGDIMGRQFAFIYDDEWRKKTIRFYRQQLTDNIEESFFLFPIISKDGEKLWMEQTATLVKENDNVIGFRCVLYDVTERIKAHEAMEEARRLATEAKEMQENFLGKMSHEIRTPMNGVVGMANLLGASPLSEKQKVYVDGIKESAVNMLRIINDILDVTKIQAGKMIFEETEFDLAKLVNGVILTLKPAADEKGVLLVPSIAENIPAILIADPVRLNQILLNLGGNALKFTEEGSVIISIQALKLIDDAITLEFKVKDTGIGIAEEKLETIFERFTQAESDTTRKYGGTGLGLSIARQLIEQQNGTISVASKLGRGTTFIFTFHCKIAKAETAKAETAKPTIIQPDSAENAGSLHGAHVLLVEDNVMNQKVARFTLEEWGVKVSVADRGIKAIDLLKANKYDLILMDIQMPEMNGIQTTEIIRKQLNDKTPIVAMTASAMRGEREKCINVGMNDYISKPFEPDDLREKILSFFTTSSGVQQHLIIDRVYLDKVCNNNVAFAREILGIYIAKTPILIEEINQYIATENYKELYPAIHNLKNSVGLLGAVKLHHDLEEGEIALIDCKPSSSNIELLKRAIQTVILSLAEAQEIVENM